MPRGGRAGGATRPQLHEIEPCELTGRDVIARFQSQFRAAALASLRILEGKSFDRVYCDYQDDFVVREVLEEGPVYHFVQVKTKRSKKHQWSRSQLFGIPANVPKAMKGVHAPGGTPALPATKEQLAKMRNSFVGKLLEHTTAFGDACGSVTFLTNVHLADEVERVAEAVLCGDVGERTVRYLADNYVAMFDITDAPEMRYIHARVGKLRLEAEQGHLDPDGGGFEGLATGAVWRFSEIDLAHTEGVELVQKLLALVQQKSSRQLLYQLTASELDDAAGIGLDDLLDLLPISRAAYRHFLTSGDTSALKNASILQRKLGAAGVNSELIEIASRWKVEWDNWFRTYRHTYEGQITFLQDELNSLYLRWARGEVSFQGLQGEVISIRSKLSSGPLGAALTEELLVGGVFAELVRSEAR